MNKHTGAAGSGYQPLETGKDPGPPPTGGSSVRSPIISPNAMRSSVLEATDAEVYAKRRAARVAELNRETERVQDGAAGAEGATVAVDGGGLRHDNGKVMYELVPPEALEALALYFTQAGGPVGGPRKYPLRNWERGMLWTRCFGALMRHSWKWMRGEDFDPETGAHRMVAVMWNASVLYAYATRGAGTDDRPRYVKTDMKE